MNTQNQKTKTQKAITPKTAKQLETNAKKVTAFLADLEKLAIVATFHKTKGLRVSMGYVGSFVTNLVNNTAKALSTDAAKFDAVKLLDALRNPKSFDGDKVVNVQVAGMLTERRVKYYSSRFGKKANAEFSAKDVHKAFLVCASKIFAEIAK